MRLRGRKNPAEELAKLHRETGKVMTEPENWKGRWSELFGNRNPIHAEFGMGKGKFIAEMAAGHPDINFIGIDRYDELIRRGAEKAMGLDDNGRFPGNLALVRFNIEHIEEMFGEGELSCIYLNFSDPWPKTRHVRRRLTHPRFIEKYQKVLNERGQIHLKTDSRTLFEFSLNVFVDMGLAMRNISLDLHAEGVDPRQVLTEYESKFIEQGMPIYRCEVLIGAAGPGADLRQI